VVAVLVGAFAVMASTQPLALADDQNPQELWNAYPLNPGDKKGEPADPAPTPTVTAGAGAGATPAATATATPTPVKDDGGGLAAPLLLGGVLVAFAVGLGAGRVARRRPPADPPAEVKTPAPAPPAAAAPAARPAPPRERPKASPPRGLQVERTERKPREPGAKHAERKPRELRVEHTERKPREPRVEHTERKPREPRADQQPRDERKPRQNQRAPAPAAPAPATPPAAPAPEPQRPRRFARRPWPPEADRAWTCVIDWKPGYVRSRFRAMVAPPGEARREPFAQSRPRWTFMDEPEPPTPDMVEVVRELVAELVDAGWVPIDRSGAWYAQRFLWAGRGQPRPLAPQKGKEADV
jgi:hypothetical protein